MKNIKRLIAAAVMTAMAFSIVGCNMISKTPKGIAKTVVAKVGSETITKGQFDDRFKQVTTQLKGQNGDSYVPTADDKNQALDSMVTEKVVLIKAKELKITPDQKTIDDNVNKQLDQIKSSPTYTTNGKFDQTKFNQDLTQAGYTEASLKEMLANQVIFSAVQDYITKDITVTDADINNYYGANIQNYTKKAGADVSHILLAAKDASGNVDFDKSLQQAKDVEARLAKGEKFADLAKTLSQDTGSAQQGGDLGYVEYDNTSMVKEFMDGVKPLKEGQISAPVKSQFGYHIITVKNIQPKGVIQKLDEVKDQIKQQLLSDAQNKKVTDTLAQWKKDLGITTYQDRL